MSLWFQGVLLHPDGEVRAASVERGRQERHRAPRVRGLRTVPGPQRPLQQKQPHWGRLHRFGFVERSRLLCFTVSSCYGSVLSLFGFFYQYFLHIHSFHLSSISLSLSHTHKHTNTLSLAIFHSKSDIYSPVRLKFTAFSDFSVIFRTRLSFFFQRYKFVFLQLWKLGFPATSENSPLWGKTALRKKNLKSPHGTFRRVKKAANPFFLTSQCSSVMKWLLIRSSLWLSSALQPWTPWRPPSLKDGPNNCSPDSSHGTTRLSHCSKFHWMYLHERERETERRSLSL